MGGEWGMPRKQESEETPNELTSDDLALLAAILVVIADAVALWAVVAARNEKSSDNDTTSGISSPLAAVVSQFTGFPVNARGRSLRSSLRISDRLMGKSPRNGKQARSKRTKLAPGRGANRRNK
jgi:hypothetical protein